MGWIGDKLAGVRHVLADGLPLPQRQSINLIGFVCADNAALQRTDVRGGGARVLAHGIWDHGSLSFLASQGINLSASGWNGTDTYTIVLEEEYMLDGVASDLYAVYATPITPGVGVMVTTTAQDSSGFSLVFYDVVAGGPNLVVRFCFRVEAFF